MTEAEAIALIRQSVAIDTWARRVRVGYPVGSIYNYRSTKLFAGVAALQAPRVEPPPPPLPKLIALARNCMFSAWNPGAALGVPRGPKWKVGITADTHVGGDELPPDAFVALAIATAGHAHDRGNLVFAWGNQAELGQGTIAAFAERIGADFAVYQAENPNEYATAMGERASIIIGNPNAWTQAQRDDATQRVIDGKLAVIFETYTNQGEQWPNVASTQGVPTASLCVGVGWGPTPYQLPDYKPHTTADEWDRMSVYLADDMTRASWEVLPA